MSNIVFIATSLDGYIADRNHGIDWLHKIDNPENLDMGYLNHMARIDALVMGRNTLDIVLNFDCDWPYSKPVFVLSNTMTSVPAGYEDKIFLVKGPLKSVIKQLNQQGYRNLYIDGGKTIQSFLKEDLIDEMILTTIPVLLGGGIPLFGELETSLDFKHVKCERFLDAIVQNHFIRQR
ncbi:dihydrofolate reductase [Thalassomonas viridans]|uniref:Dihydrofolate reductase n=1 Tax=Thalassomonas viridans TaxID=137584 RepID=A0AAE9Z3Z9_9GAMM|nr:dihydrofolate reductase family protein [Thalassomonas viridans]WDE06153.1 dihydrofolate reductase [Thalassomonas viridans]